MFAIVAAIEYVAAKRVSFCFSATTHLELPCHSTRTNEVHSFGVATPISTKLEGCRPRLSTGWSWSPPTARLLDHSPSKQKHHLQLLEARS